MLRIDDVALIISSSGRIAELLTVAETAQARGAKVIAITESQSPLARKADLALIVDHVEDIATQVPMIKRILLMVDILVVGVTLHRGASVPALGSDATKGLDEVAPGGAVCTHRTAQGAGWRSAAGPVGAFDITQPIGNSTHRLCGCLARWHINGHLCL